MHLLNIEQLVRKSLNGDPKNQEEVRLLKKNPQIDAQFMYSEYFKRRIRRSILKERHKTHPNPVFCCH
jgi:hypothetical protein